MDKKFIKNNFHYLFAAIFLFSMVLTYMSSQRAIQTVLEFSVVENSQSIANIFEIFRKVYTTEVVNKIKQNQFNITHDFRNNDEAIPLPASMTFEIGKALGKKDNHTEVRLYSPFPFPLRISTGGLKDDFQKAAWAAINKNPDNDFYRIDYVNGNAILRYAKADILKPECVECHNTHPQTPFNKWQIGDVRGILEIYQPIAPIVNAGKQEIYALRVFEIISVFIGLFGIFIVVYVYKKRLEEQFKLQAELESRNSELEEFSYRTSHDLKAPLTTSKKLSEFVIHDISQGNLEEAKKNSIIVMQQMEKLENLVLDILNIAKSDLSDEENKLISFTEIMDDITSRNSILISESGCKLFQNIDVSKTIYGNKTRLTQIIENLFTNSIKYKDTSKNESFIKINIFETNDMIHISVEDNGLGIPEKFHKDLFKMFKRFHPKIASGSGLGLALVKKQIDFLAGEITFNTSDQGTLFLVTLPKG